MMEQDYTNLCNLASELDDLVQARLARHSTETVKQLEDLVRFERQATGSPNGCGPAYLYLEAMLRREIEYRERPNANVVRVSFATSNEIPF